MSFWGSVLLQQRGHIPFHRTKLTISRESKGPIYMVSGTRDNPAPPPPPPRVTLAELTFQIFL